MSDLRKIPGVGARIEQAMQAIGIRCIADLVGRDPEELYCLDCRQKGFQEDRCAGQEKKAAVCLSRACAAGSGKIEVVVLERGALLRKRRQVT